MANLTVKFLRLWQAVISPLYPQSCRFYPSCSEYAVISVKKYGTVKGLLKTIWRILRCHPLSKGGVDLP